MFRSLRKSTPLAAAATLLLGSLVTFGAVAPGTAHANRGTLATCTGDRFAYRPRLGYRYENDKPCYTSLEQFPNISLGTALRIIDELQARTRLTIPDGFACRIGGNFATCYLLARTRDQRNATSSSQANRAPTIVSTRYLRDVAARYR